MPFEYGGQMWPDTTVVTERFDVTFRQGETSEEFPVTRYKLCLQTHREGAPEYSCAHVRNPQSNGDGTLTGRILILREGGTDSDAYLDTNHGRTQPSLSEARSLTPEQQAFYSETLQSPLSNRIEMPQAKPHVVPEPGMGLMLAIGLLGLWVAGWRRKTR